LQGENCQGVPMAVPQELNRNIKKTCLKYSALQVALALTYTLWRVEKAYTPIKNVGGFIQQSLRFWEDWKRNINLKALLVELGFFIYNCENKGISNLNILYTPELREISELETY
jgi:hypothetical protein